MDSKRFMKQVPNRIQKFALVLALGLVPAIVCQFFTPEPVARHIHIRNFR